MDMHGAIPENMLAVCLDAEGRLSPRNVPVPRPGKGEVLIQMAAAPVNPSDLARIKHLDPIERSSFIGGIEGSGKVVAHGKGLLPGLWMGKRVACSSSHNNSGSWAEYMVSAAMGCIPLPDAINDEQGSMLLVNPLTAVAFFDIIRQNKHKAVINTAAASSLGRFNELLGRKNNIPLIHIVRNENQVRTLKDRGAEFVLNSASNEFENDLHTYVTRLGATLALDAVGGSLTRQLLSALPYGGTVIIYGNLSGEDPETDHRSLVADNKQISGFYLVNWLKEQGMLTMIRSIVHARQLLKNEVSVAVQSRFPLERAQEAVDTYLANMSAGKVLLVPGFNLR